MFYYYYDWTYILVLIGVVLSLLASAKVKSTFARYSNVRSYSGMTGRDAAEKILHRNGIYDVQIIHISGNLTDHYNPTNKTLALSDPVYHSTSVAAIGVAAHECGHAVQHQVGYAPLSVRSALVQPGGPTMITPCPPAAATCNARFAISCPRTSE